MSADDSVSSARPAYGWFLIVVAGCALVFAGGIPSSGVGSNADPGPRAFPMALALVLLAGGVHQVATGSRWCRRLRGESASKESGEPIGFGSVWERWREVVILALALGIYVPVMPWLGFGISTLLFSGIMMMRLGVRWWIAASMAAGLVLGVKMLFGVLFKVPLPEGFLPPWTF